MKMFPSCDRIRSRVRNLKLEGNLALIQQGSDGICWLRATASETTLGLVLFGELRVW